MLIARARRRVAGDNPLMEEGPMDVAECRRISFEPQLAQPPHYVHAVILGSEERQPLMEEDIPLPFGVPAAALKHAPRRVS